MKKITFKKDGYDYIAYVDGKATEYCISNAYGVWSIWKGDEKFNGFDYLKDAKQTVIHFIEADEKRNNVYATQYIVISITTKEILCNTNDYDYARQVADENSGYMITTEFNGFDVPMSLSGCLY